MSMKMGDSAQLITPSIESSPQTGLPLGYVSNAPLMFSTRCSSNKLSYELVLMLVLVLVLCTL